MLHEFASVCVLLCFMTCFMVEFTCVCFGCGFGLFADVTDVWVVVKLRTGGC